VTAPSPDRSSAGRTAGIVLGWLIYLLGFGLLGTPVLIYLFGAPIDPLVAFLVAVGADLALLAVLITAMVLSSPRRRSPRAGGVIMLAAGLLLIVGFGAAYAAIMALAS
jgi:dolichol kinase